MRIASGSLAWALTAIGLVLQAASAVPTAQAPTSSLPTAYLAEVDGIIHPVSAEYLRAAIASADAAGAAVLIITLRTPGGLVDSTRDINTAIIGARTPVVVFVGPSGSRAASAGFLITIAADVAAMAPGTHIGAAHPVSGDGQKVDEVMAKKMASDVAGYARTIAAQRKRNVDLVEQAVTESRTYTEQEALAAAPPLIDLVATDVPDLLAKLDGRTVTRFDGRTMILRTAGAVTHSVRMSWSQQALSALAHPQIAYLLLMLGTLGLTVELWSPGAVLPGVAGGICLLLAFFAFQVLPVSAAGILLILFGMVLLILEVKVTSYGVLAVGGLVSLILGSMMLIDSPLPELRVGLRLILPITVAVAGILFFLVRLAVQSQRTPSVTGDTALLAETGLAVSAFGPGVVGQIQTHGELWSAASDVPIHAGDTVRVVAVRGLTLTVAPVARAPIERATNPAHTETQRGE